MKSLLPTAALAAAFSLSCQGAWASAHHTQLADLADLSLEQLTKVTVTSASRREEPLVAAPASIFVITGDDIRRSGATSLPEALRLAPNLQVMRRDTSQYVVSARGGLTNTANKMLVMIDGRTIYTPLFSGVFYDAVAIVLEDVERIEVISGPGSTLWGTNAVNGVVNVIMKPAGKTPGGLAAPLAGDKERGASLRYGWAVGEHGAMRLSGRYVDRDDHQLERGGSALDAARRGEIALRGDWRRGRAAASAQAAVYEADVGNLAGDRDLRGGHVYGQWRGDLGADNSVTLHAYFDRTEREHRGSFQETRDTFEIEAQHHMVPMPGHRVAWGASHRTSRDRTVPSASLGFIPAARTLPLTSLYAQDEIEIGDRLRVTLGLRAERNDYTGMEWLPNLRASYTIAPSQYLWGALTRTARSPSRIDRDLVVPGSPPFSIVNNDNFVSEIASVAEVGYRGNVSPGMSVSITAFHHRFTDLRTMEPAAGGATVLANGGRGRVSGLEGWGDFRLGSDWRLLWGFTWMRDRFELAPGRVNLTENPLGNNPRRTVRIGSQWNLGAAVEVDVVARYVGDLPDPAIPSHATADARVGWRALPRLELSLAVLNVFDRRHAEFGTPATRAVFERSWIAKATWTF